MKRAWLVGVVGLVGVVLLDQPRSFGGHGRHAGGSHAVKESHPAPKHSGGKPAPHPAPKPPAKPQGKPSLKPLPKPQIKPKDNHANSHKPDAGKSSAHLNRPNAVGSGSKTQPPNTNDNKTTHHEEHHHHEWHHDRWWHGHHHVWSSEGFWVDATTGAPVVAADGAVAATGSDGGPTGSALVSSAGGPTGGSVAGRPQVHFSVDPSQLDSYDAAAQAAGMSRAEWIRSRLDAAVGKELK